MRSSCPRIRTPHLHRSAVWLAAVALFAIFANGTAAEDNGYAASIAHLRTAQQALGQGKLADAKAAYNALLQSKDAPAHYQQEAQERLQEIARVEKGLPARDPLAHRVKVAPRPTPGVVLWVAPNGDDANPGSQEKPFCTLGRARDAIRALKKDGKFPAGGVEVRVRGGEYQATDCLKLEKQDSGTLKSPIAYCSAPGERPCFRGGIRVHGFQPLTDADLLAQLPEEARGKVLAADLKPLGVKNLKPLELGGFCSGRGFVTHPVTELFCDGKAMPLSRWPNQGFVDIKDVAVYDGEPLHGIKGSKTGRFYYEGDRPSRWRKAPDAWLYGYWFWGWADSYEPIASIDPQKHEITLQPPHPNWGFRKGQPFCVVNLLAEIDMPGEWYLDRQNAVLYFWPPTDVQKAMVELSLTDFPFVSTDHASCVAFEGLTWELAAGDAVKIEGGHHCLLAGCTVRRCGGDGVTINGGADHGLLSCNIHALGRGGTVINGGDRKTLAPARHFLENCDIYDLSRIDHTYTPAIVMTGVGNRIAHNMFHDILSSAIRLGGNDHVVEYNDVYRVVLESDDQGGVDMWGNATFRGNIIRFNSWSHIGNWRDPEAGPHCGQAGVRLDDAISGVLIYGNIFHRAAAGKLGFGGVQIHGGKDNIVDNNVFADCATAVSLSTWGAKRWQDFVAQTLDAPAIDRALYLQRYPLLAQLAENPDRNTVTRNLVVHCGGLFRRNSKPLEVLDNLVTDKDPGFRNAAQGDFALPNSAPGAVEIGFRPIPVDEIGMYVDKYRTELPPRHTPEKK